MVRGETETGNKKRQTLDKILLIPKALDFSVTGFNKLPFFFPCKVISIVTFNQRLLTSIILLPSKEKAKEEAQRQS